MTPDNQPALPELLRDLLDYVDAETCTHQGTHRGGIIWTICDDCGRKWADDEGGFVPYADPPAVANARAGLESLSRAEGATLGGGREYHIEHLDAEHVRLTPATPAQRVPTVEYDRELIAEMLDRGRPYFADEAIDEQIKLLRAADNAEAAGVRTAQRVASPCVVCGADEPFTGTCGSNDQRALCASAKAAQRVAAGDEWPECSGDPIACPENEGFGCCKSTNLPNVTKGA